MFKAALMLDGDEEARMPKGSVALFTGDAEVTIRLATDHYIAESKISEYRMKLK